MININVEIHMGKKIALKVNMTISLLRVVHLTVNIIRGFFLS